MLSARLTTRIRMMGDLFIRALRLLTLRNLPKVRLLSGAPTDHLPTTLALESAKFCKLLLLALENLMLPL
jgi:hypothetical protein